MARFFNTAGPCEPRDHYMLPPRRRLPDIEALIGEKAYFVVHAPRQSGKTTCFHHLARELTAAGRYAAVLSTCETARTASDDIDRAMNAVLLAIHQDADQQLPAELRPEPLERFAELTPEGRLKGYLTAWCERSPRPVVLFLDEIDAVFGMALISILQQLRSGYRSRRSHPAPGHPSRLARPPSARGPDPAGDRADRGGRVPGRGSAERRS